MNFFDDKTLKKILYTFVAVLLVAIIVFVAIYIWYDNQLSMQSENYSLANELTDNKKSKVEETDEASYTQDKNIAKVENTTNSIENKNEISKPSKNLNTVAAKEKNKVENTAVEKPKVEVKKELKFQAPVEGEIIKDYANETLIYSKTLDEWTTHLGIDIAGKKTGIVKAAEDGTVESIKNDPRYGLTITISHIDGFKTVYSNLLTTEFVSEGKSVKKGETIATIGESASFEILDETHLHFEMYKDEVSVNPTVYLK